MPYWVLIIFAISYDQMSPAYVPFDTEKECTKAAENIKFEISKIPSGSMRKPTFLLICQPTGR